MFWERNRPIPYAESLQSTSRHEAGLQTEKAIGRELPRLDIARMTVWRYRLIQTAEIVDCVPTTLLPPVPALF